MPRILEQIFTINSDTNSDYVSFFRRYVGDSGRDIAAVKQALGEIYQYTPDDIEQPEDNSIGTSWFTCANNTPVSEEKTKIFDNSLKAKLMSYQLSNQFVIMSYYFEALSVRNITNLSSLESQIQAVINFFDSEFGTIGEGTLACLHGWRPNSIIYNSSFVTDNNTVIDQVPSYFLELITQEVIAEPSNRVVEQILTSADDEYASTLESFLRNTHASKKMSEIVPEASFVLPVYSPVSIIGQITESVLFAAAQQVMASGMDKTIFETKAEDRYRDLAPMLEPDPLSDPPPFELGSRKIGFFDRTEFTLQSLPDFTSVPPQLQQKMEDDAFFKVLNFYKKPVIWNLTDDLNQNDELTFSDDESRQVYENAIAAGATYRVTTKAAISQFSLQQDSYDAVYGVNLLAVNKMKNIHFIEYRTPSLRPEDVYRSYFEMNLDYLDEIKTGQTSEQLQEVVDNVGEASRNAMGATQAEIASLYCVENANSEDAARAKFEKYKAFAMKRKLEISRELRSKAIQASVGEDVNVDLGVFGNIPILDILDDTEFSAEDLVEAGFDGVASLLNSVLPAIPPPGSIKYTLKFFEESVQALEKIFRSDKTAEDVKTFKISSGNQEPLNLQLEADNFASFPGYIRDMAITNFELVALATANGLSVAQLLEEGSGGSALTSGFGGTGFSTGTEFQMNFDGPTISSIYIINNKLSINVAIYSAGSVGTLVGSMTMPRSVNYIRNIGNMLPIPSSGLSAISDFIGLNSSPCSDSTDQPSVGAALILKYTIHNNGLPVQFEKELDMDNVLHNWAENYLQREEVRRVLDFFDDKEAKMFEKVEWGKDTILPEIGPICTLDELYRDFVKKVNLSKLLCNYLSCLQIPEVNVQFPNLTLPELPDIPIFQYPGLDNIVEDVLEAIEAVVVRILCAFIRNLLDILSSPFCEDQLVSDLFGASNASPEIQRAFASAFIDTGIPKDKTEAVNSMMDDLINFLTPRELCALLEGSPVNGQVHSIIKNLSVNYGLEDHLTGREKITQFFTSIGAFIPKEFCSALVSNNILGLQNCRDTANILSQIRNAASRGEVDPQRVADAVAQAEKNIMDKSKAFQLMTGELSLQDMFPNFSTAAVKGAAVLEESSKVVVDSTLDIVKRSFLSSMDNYVRSMYLDVSSLVTIDDTEYDPVATMKFLRATNNLLRIQNFNVSGANFESQGLTVYLRRTLLRLVDDFETVQYKDFLIYRSQLEALKDRNVTATGADPSESFPGTQEDNEESNEFPFAGINTPLKGSLLFGSDLSDEIIEAGITGLIGEVAPATPSYRLMVQQEANYSTIFEYLFPISLDVSKLDEEATELADEPVLSDEISTEMVSTWSQWNNNRYVGIDEDDELDNDPRNLSLNLSYLRAINTVVNKLQQDVEQTLEAVFRVVDKEKLLEVIRDFYNIELEAQREEGQGRTNARGQLIKTNLITNGQEVILEHPVLVNSTDTSDGTPLMSTKMTDKTVSRNYISNQTDISDSFFLGTSDNPVNRISLCEEVPEAYRDSFDEDVTNNPLRRKVFKEQITRIAKHYYDSYKLPGDEDFEDIEELDLLDEASGAQYLNVLEGVMEQMVSYMGESRIFTDLDYVLRLESKIKSRRYFEETNGQACIINPFNKFDEGAIKFSEIISDIFPEEYTKELSDPANSIYTMDFTRPGPFEKAMMTTALLGYIRVICLEALMKGAIAYSSWDIDFVRPDPLFKEYIYTLVENNVNGEEIFQKYSVLVDDTFKKLSGTNNKISAIREIVNKELSTSISILSKVLFENSTDEKYINWFLNRMFIVDAPWHRRDESGLFADYDGEWISELTEEDINQYRQNSFTYLERYIRTNGQLSGVLGPVEGLAARQRDALFEFIRIDGEGFMPYPMSFKSKLYGASDPEFLAVPISLDIPTREDVESFNIGDQNSLIDIDLAEAGADNDQWPDRELWSLEDFNQLMIRIFSNNPGVQKYIFHLLKKFYDEDDQTSIWHGKPKTLRDRMPIKAVRRKRFHYTFSENDYFSSRMEEDFSGIVQQSTTRIGAPFLERDQDPFSLYSYVSNQADQGGVRSFEGGDPVSDPVPFDLEAYNKRKFQDRYYIISTDGEDLFDEEQEKIGIDIKVDNSSPEEENWTPRRGVSVDASGRLSPWHESEETSESREIDTIRVIEPGESEEAWIPEGLTPGETIFENITGKVTEEQWTRFTDNTRGILSEEIWEEYIIDLQSAAAPIFNQIGDSEFDPDEEVAQTSRNVMANAMNDVFNLVFTPGDSGGENHKEKRFVFSPENFENDVGNVFKAVRDTTGIVTEQTDEQWAEDQNGFDDPGYHSVNIVRGPGYLDFANTGVAAANYTFWSNDIEVRFDSQLGHYRIRDESARILLNRNEYKIPLRIVMTQVKDSVTGAITKVFVRYLIPKTLTFSLSMPGVRGSRVATAVRAGRDGYISFFKKTYARGKQDTNELAQTFRSSQPVQRVESDQNPPIFLDTPVVAIADERQGDEFCAAVNLLLGANGPYDDFGNIPVVFRSEKNTMPGKNSANAAFFSVEKMWSHAGQIEASGLSDHFVADLSPTEHTEFDKLFKKNIGNLLRRPTGQTLSYTQVLEKFSSTFGLDPQAPDHHILNEENRSLLDSFARRIVMYSKATQHGFYDKTFEEMMDTDASDVIVSIGNLVGWFSQRRVDGIYGATSKQCKGMFEFEGVAPGPKGINIGKDVFRNEAADFDCGPSLFYRDGRVLLESYLATLYDMALDPDAFAATEQDKTVLYNNTFRHFRAQNIYKLRHSIYRDSSAGFSPEQQGHTMPGVNHTRKEQKTRPKTLVTHRTDIVTHAATLDFYDKDYVSRAAGTTAGNGFATIVDISFMPTSLCYNVELFPADDNTLESAREAAQRAVSYFSANGLSIDFNAGRDQIFHNPLKSIKDGSFPDEVINGGFGSTSSRFGANKAMLTRIRENSSLAVYFARALQEAEKYPQLLERLSNRFDQSLRWAQDLITELYKIMAGLDEGALSLLEALEVKHGLRMNLVLGHDTTDIRVLTDAENQEQQDQPGLDFNIIGVPDAGVLQESLPSSADGLGLNINTSGVGVRPVLTGTRAFINNIWSAQTEVGEEERIGRIHYRAGGGSRFENYTSVPIAYHEKPVFVEDICDPVINYIGIPDVVRARDEQMIDAISEEEEFKTFYDFSVPYRRIGSLLTVHSTSMLAGYSTMPRVLQSTKASLAAVFSLMAERDNFDSLSAKQFGSNFSQLDIAAAQGTAFPAGGESLDCFSLPDAGPWFTMIKEMIEQFIKYFPAVVLRGIASDIDPAYKELKSHYFACETPSLDNDAVGVRSGTEKTEFGLRGSKKGEKQYIPIFPSFPVDLAIGMSRLLSFNTDGGVYLGKSLDRMISYAIGGPQQIIDASYAFQIPCLEDERFNQTGRMRDWEKYEIGKFGRYGHPMTPLTYLALSTRHLPRDLEYRQQSCQLSDFASRGVVPTICEDPEE